ncbi:hypothetical protein Salat_1895100 [Sesamum alatum]|uniref:Uncharacterized protein n=1 Tax=Sesamum alatum TaxID=300844 RepID=A0AAE2CI97_9LAMI|nr:hypothetical protein Salat_1895100 [Sesamum alatum]
MAVVEGMFLAEVSSLPTGVMLQLACSVSPNSLLAKQVQLPPEVLLATAGRCSWYLLNRAVYSILRQHCSPQKIHFQGCFLKLPATFRQAGGRLVDWLHLSLSIPASLVNRCSLFWTFWGQHQCCYCRPFRFGRWQPAPPVAGCIFPAAPVSFKTATQQEGAALHARL